MFKLTRVEEQKFDALISDAKEALGELNDEITQVNHELERIHNSLDQLTNTYNNALSRLSAFIELNVEDWRREWEEKSEKWQESDRGEEISQWIDEWERVVLENAEFDIPQQLDEIEDPFDELEHLSRDASESV